MLNYFFPICLVTTYLIPQALKVCYIHMAVRLGERYWVEMTVYLFRKKRLGDKAKPKISVLLDTIKY